MKILRFRKRDDGSFRLVVHVDETKLDDDGKPDPEFVRRFDWPPKPDDFGTQAEYVAMIRREAKLLLEAEAGQEALGTKIAGEDEEL